MNAQQLARLMHEEHVKLNDLTSRLQEKVAMVPQTNQAKWIGEVRECFEHLRAHMIKQMALEERDGYMPWVMQRRPALAAEVDRLEHEHRELMRLLNGIHLALEQVGAEDPLLIRDCCHRIENLLSYVQHHEADENRMVLAAFTEDIGTKD